MNSNTKYFRETLFQDHRSEHRPVYSCSSPPLKKIGKERFQYVFHSPTQRSSDISSFEFLLRTRKEISISCHNSTNGNFSQLNSIFFFFFFQFSVIFSLCVRVYQTNCIFKLILNCFESVVFSRFERYFEVTIGYFCAIL